MFMKWLSPVILVCTLAFSSCMPQPVNYHDEELIPYLQAIKKVQKLRDSCGFTPVSVKAKISLEGKSESYDAMLHVYQNISSRTIAFKEDNGKYVWIGEQETFTGPKSYETVDGNFKETLTLNYETQNISGHRTDTLDVQYGGPDNLCSYPCAIPISDIKSLIKTWMQSK
jgi:hypothetical protein